MRKLWMALVTVAALTIGAVFAEGVNNGTAEKSCGADKSCCCCAKSCEK
jgi:hypothetical protein